MRGRITRTPRPSSTASAIQAVAGSGMPGRVVTQEVQGVGDHLEDGFEALHCPGRRSGRVEDDAVAADPRHGARQPFKADDLT